MKLDLLSQAGLFLKLFLILRYMLQLRKLLLNLVDILLLAVLVSLFPLIQLEGGMTLLVRLGWLSFWFIHLARVDHLSVASLSYKHGADRLICVRLLRS